MFASDMDGDGDLDVLSASRNGDKIAWYENDGNQLFTVHTISTVADGAWSVHAADVDGDGDLDVLSASSIDDKIAWYENDGSERFTAHIIAINSAADGARAVFAADVDNDGDLDVLSASSGNDKIAWYENHSPIISGSIADLTGNGFVDFDDLTVLLSSWNQDVSATLGNLVDAENTPVDFDDLTVLLAAWTGPEPDDAPQVAAAGNEESVFERSRVTIERHFNDLGRRDDGMSRRVSLARTKSSQRSPLRRLQAVAVDLAMAEESAPDEAKIIRRRTSSRARR